MQIRSARGTEKSRVRKKISRVTPVLLSMAKRSFPRLIFLKYATRKSMSVSAG
jgi:hypothetical protein